MSSAVDDLLSKCPVVLYTFGAARQKAWVSYHNETEEGEKADLVAKHRCHLIHTHMFLSRQANRPWGQVVVDVSILEM